jgi:hypothetical protein
VNEFRAKDSARCFLTAYLFLLFELNASEDVTPVIRVAFQKRQLPLTHLFGVWTILPRRAACPCHCDKVVELSHSVRTRATGRDYLSVALFDVARILSVTPYKEDVRLRLVHPIAIFLARHLQSGPPFQLVQLGNEEQFRVLRFDLPRFFSIDEAKDLAQALIPACAA